MINPSKRQCCRCPSGFSPDMDPGLMLRSGSPQTQFQSCVINPLWCVHEQQREVCVFKSLRAFEHHGNSRKRKWKDKLTTDSTLYFDQTFWPSSPCLLSCVSVNLLKLKCSQIFWVVVPTWERVQVSEASVSELRLSDLQNYPQFIVLMLKCVTGGNVTGRWSNMELAQQRTCCYYYYTW